MDDAAIEVTPEEIREFLEADHRAVRVDLEFKERLRRKLWAIVRLRDGGAEDS